MNGNKASLILNIASAVISLVLAVGAITFFRACGVHEDGSYGSCHWAQQAVFASGIAALLQSIVLFFVKKKTARAAVSACVAVLAVITALIPGTFIRLCALPGMRCLSVMRPCVLALCIVLAVVCVVNIAVNLKGKPKDVGSGF